MEQTKLVLPLRLHFRVRFVCFVVIFLRCLLNAAILPSEDNHETHEPHEADTKRKWRSKHTANTKVQEPKPVIAGTNSPRSSSTLPWSSRSPDRAPGSSCNFSTADLLSPGSSTKLGSKIIFEISRPV